MAFSSMSFQSASSIWMFTLRMLLVSNSAVSYSCAMPLSPAQAVSWPEKATAQRHRQTAAAMTAATIFVMCLCASMGPPPRYDRYSPL